MLNKNKFWKYCRFLAPLGFAFIFITQGIESNYERASDKLISAELINERIDKHSIYMYRGFKTDEITIDGQKYLLNQDTLPNVLVENILDYSVSKHANSTEIEFAGRGKSLTFNLWTYNKAMYWIKRILFSLCGAIFFLVVGFIYLNLGN